MRRIIITEEHDGKEGFHLAKGETMIKRKREREKEREREREK